MAFGESGVAPHEFLENAGRRGQIVFLGQNQAELNASVSVFGIEANGFVEFASGSVQITGASHGQSEIVMCFRKIGIGERGLPKFIHGALRVSLAPVQQAQAGMNLRVIRLELQRLLERSCGLRGIALTLPCNAQIVVTGRESGLCSTAFWKSGSA